MNNGTSTTTTFQRPHESLGTVSQMMDLALQAGRQELVALKEGDVETAEACCSHRASLVELALERHGPDDKVVLRAGLMKLQELQEALTEEGRQLRTKLMGQINRSKAEGRRMQGYRRAVNHALM